ncbi:DUF2760 [Desulfonema limicola]|uniref:DUF2760 n=1 Tax=Desulfonema limicola TaxID=45656 RepID=A0A975B9U9_9BACT|nr:DUF2760 domain-containing protein [Desulfonema limicola]QTA81351.1 DUF2760 [Desulfonema limicola]
MEIVRLFSRRLLFWIIFFMGITCALINSALYLAMDYIVKKLSVLSQVADAPPELLILNESGAAAAAVNQFYLPAVICLFLITGLLLWLCLRMSLSKLMTDYEARAAVPADKPGKLSEFDIKEKERADKRLFLHLFSVLQREGRLMDFFSEDIEEYDDEQIGAAVRNIHDNCKKAVDKYLTAAPVVEQEEDEDILVEPGFDPNAVKLTGNVTGDPPFKGIVRHRGWKAENLELPSLSGSRDPEIIAPAEVEIL